MVESEKTYCGINDGKTMKQILNNILNANTWLFLELVIITVVAWAVFEPAIVNLYYRNLPLGYDSDQLLYAVTAVNGEPTVDEDGTLHDAFEITEERRDQMLRQLMAVEGVESASLFDQPYGSMGYSQAAFNECCAGGDTLLLANVTLTTDAYFFETYGLKPLPGSPSDEELSHIKTVDRQVVLTRSGAIALFGTEDAVGRHFTICYDPAYEVTVAGVVEDFRMSVPTTIRSMIITTKELQTTSCQYVIRLKQNQRLVDAVKDVCDEVTAEAAKSDKTYFVRYCEFKYQAASWSRERRVVCRIELHKREEQSLFPDSLMFIVTNLDAPMQEVVAAYCKRGTMENFFKEAKNEFAFTHMSSRSMLTNSNRLWIAALAYNIFNLFRRFCLNKKWQSYRAHELRLRLMKIAGRVTRHANKTIFKLCSSCPHQEVFRQAHVRILSLAA